MKLQLSILSMAVLMPGFSAFGQGEDLIIVSSEAFSEAAVCLPLPGNQPPSSNVIAPGASAERIFRKWGITVRGSGSALPVVRWIPPINISLPSHHWSIANIGSPNFNQPMVIDFDIPVRRVRFTLFADPEGTTVSAFDSSGQLLGAIASNQLADGNGLESTGAMGISKLVIDYGDVAREEEINDWVVEFVTRSPVFELYIPQIADGQVLVAGQLVSLKSVLRISSLQSKAGTDGILEFFDSDSQPLSLSVNGDGISSAEFLLDPNVTFVISTDGNSAPVASGYGRIRANGPFAATSEFTVVDAEGGVVTEAGISGTGPVFLATGAVASNVENSLDSAVALVNTSEEEPAFLRIGVFGSGIARIETIVQLQPGQHTAQFIRELFPSLPENFEGTLSISSGVPMASTVLRTQDGLPLSSLQLDSLELAAP